MESRLLKEAALREVEKRRLRELEEVKRELQRLLEEERQAKRDEEIVRQLQARYKIIHLKNSCFWLKTGNICAFTITCVSVYYKIIESQYYALKRLFMCTIIINVHVQLHDSIKTRNA